MPLLLLAGAVAAAAAPVVEVDPEGSVTVQGALWLGAETPRMFCKGWKDLPSCVLPAYAAQLWVSLLWLCLQFFGAGP
eukprot:gene3479-3942_t